MPKSNIIINLQIEGIHCWPECPIEEVSFLRDPHRHIFHIECKKAVSHLDRDVEIIQLKRKILSWLYEMYSKTMAGTHDFGRMSCEEIATKILNEFELNYCKVLEDGENGAEIFI